MLIDSSTDLVDCDSCSNLNNDSGCSLKSKLLQDFSMSISLFGSNYKQTSNHAKENKPHKNSVYFVHRISEINIRFYSQMP